MKKNLFMLAVLPMMALTFSSCSSDDDDDFPLNGTTWEYMYEEGDDKRTETLVFGKETMTYSMVATFEGEENKKTHTGTYIYAHPTVTMTILDETLTGTISGNKMTSQGNDGEIYIFTKK